MKLEAAGATHIGCTRPRNEDHFLVAELAKTLLVRATSIESAAGPVAESRPATLLAVADGLGGAPAGANASSLAIDGAARHIVEVMPWFRQPPESDDGVLDDLGEAFRRARARLASDVAAHPAHAGMATTLSMALIIGPRLYLAHVGDSRIYLWREGRLAPLTRDHVHDSAHDGATPGVLWNVVTAAVDPQPEAHVFRLEHDDVILLCTDGLHNHLTDEEMAAMIGDSATAESVVDRLIGAALARGGRDNATLVVARATRRSATPPAGSLIVEQRDMEDTRIAAG